MSLPAWAPATLYLPGAIVRSTVAAPVTNQAITNPGFESGDTAWSKSNTTIVNEAGSFTGTWHAKMVYAGGATGYVRTTSILPVSPGQSVTASCMYNPSGASIGVGGQVRILWYDASNTYISGKDAVGNGIDTSNGSGWRKSSVTGSAPASAAGFRVQGDTYNTNAAGVVLIDAFTLAVSGGPAANPYIFKATQADAATSGASEPVWPTTVGGTVVDGGVTWEAIDAVVITWEASPILESGGTEPTWPTNLGDTVADGSIAWEAISRRIEDENCPNTKVVLILSSKVFAVDEDIVRFSATANPKDWTSEQDAGYLPTGLQSSNASDMSVLAAYRNNLIPMNASCLQNWQVDPDPQSMALLDQMDGIGSIYNMAAQPVANDLFYLSQLGVRSIGIAASTDNLAAGDIGMPIDELVQDAIDVAQGTGMEPLATYYPGAGQYWLAVPQLDAVACSIATTYQGGQAVPSVNVITIGSDTGPMIFNFATGFCPDKAEVWIGGVMVLDTGWWGDPSWQDRLDAACTAVGISSGTINAIPNTTHNAYQQWDAGEAASFAINKNTADTTAIVKIYAPVGGTAWKFLLGCPNDLTIEPKPEISLVGHIPDGIIGASVSGAYEPVGGLQPYSDVTLVSGDMPPGVTLNADGTYSGTFTTTGTYSRTLSVTDDQAQVATLDDTTVVTSLNIFNWRLQSIPNDDSGEGVFVDGDYIAVGQDNGQLVYSNARGVDGSWTAVRAHPSNVHPFGVIKYNGDWYCFGDWGSSQRASKALGNSFSFSAITAPPQTMFSSPCAFVVDGNAYIGTINSGGTYILYAFDGATYTAIDTGIATRGSSGQITGIKKCGSVYLLCTSDGCVLRSTNMSTFTLVFTYASAFSITSLSYIDGKVRFGVSQDNKIYTSTDIGLTWDAGVTASSTNGGAITMDNGHHLIEASWGTTVAVFTSPTGVPGSFTERLNVYPDTWFVTSAGHSTETLAVYPLNASNLCLVGDVS